MNLVFNYVYLEQIYQLNVQSVKAIELLQLSEIFLIIRVTDWVQTSNPSTCEKKETGLSLHDRLSISAKCNLLIVTLKIIF